MNAITVCCQPHLLCCKVDPRNVTGDSTLVSQILYEVWVVALPKAWHIGKSESRLSPIPVNMNYWPYQDESRPVCQFVNMLVSIKDDTVSGFLLLEG